MNEPALQDIVTNVSAIAKKAGQAILDVYNSDDFAVEIKQEDTFDSPLTKADKAANKVIEQGLKEISDYPIVSEENETRDVSGEYFWLVDPLDGTKEFINRNGEFTVNIALIKSGEPVLGVVCVPVKDVTYFATRDTGACKQQGGNNPEKIHANYNGDKPKVVVSRRHRNEETEKFLEEIGEFESVSMGSSLKLCLVAEGKASIYPRLAPTSIWDTAAADAIVRSAGGSVETVGGAKLKYNPSQILNPHFIVWAENAARTS